MRSTIDRISDCIPALRRYAWALLREPNAADDLVHDCLERALSNLSTHSEARDVRPWLFTIMHNLHVSQRRKARVRSVVTSIELADERDLATTANQENASHLGQVLRALDGLDEEQRAVLLLVCVEDLTYAETAQALGIPLGTVMSRLSRGRESLRQALTRQHVVPFRRVK